MRTFVSLTLPEPRRARLLKLLEDMRSQGALKGRAVRAKNLHLTLAFIGDIDAGTAGRLAARIAEIEPVDLRFEFSHTGAFRSGILWAGLEEKEKFEALAARVREILEEVERELRRQAFQGVTSRSHVLGAAVSPTHLARLAQRKHR